MGTFILTPEQMQQLYERRKDPTSGTLLDLGKEFDVSEVTARKALKMMGGDPRKPSDPKQYDEVVRAFVAKNPATTRRVVMDKFGLTVTQVRNIFYRIGFKSAMGGDRHTGRTSLHPSGHVVRKPRPEKPAPPPRKRVGPLPSELLGLDAACMASIARLRTARGILPTEAERRPGLPVPTYWREAAE